MPAPVISALVKSMKQFLFVFLFMLPAYAWSVELSDYYGVWRGAVVQGPATGKTHDRYDVVVELAPGKYTIDYPSLKCGGKLRLRGNNGRHFHFRDELEYGREHCVLGGYTELLMISTTHAAFQWFDSDGVLRAKGMLKRNSQTIAL